MAMVMVSCMSLSAEEQRDAITSVINALETPPPAPEVKITSEPVVKITQAPPEVDYDRIKRETTRVAEKLNKETEKRVADFRSKTQDKLVEVVSRVNSLEEELHEAEKKERGDVAAIRAEASTWRKDYDKKADAFDKKINGAAAHLTGLASRLALVEARPVPKPYKPPEKLSSKQRDEVQKIIEEFASKWYQWLLGIAAAWLPWLSFFSPTLRKKFAEKMKSE